MLIALLVFLISLFVVQTSSAAEGDQQVHDVITMDEEGFSDKAKRAWSYLFRGDSTAIAASISDDLEARVLAIKEAEGELNMREASLVAERAEMSELQESLQEESLKMQTAKAQLTQCVLDALEVGGDN